MSVCQMPETETALMIRDCLKRNDSLTDWEKSFLKSIETRSHDLNAMQLAKLEEIWGRIT
jgi:hypothetical protein